MNPQKMTGSRIVIETLIEQGVTDVFGYPGGQVLNIYDELYKASDRIHHYLAAHEQGAAHAADGYSRVTGKVGVVIATSGPGATNLVTGIATAMLDSIPMVAITGNVGVQLGAVIATVVVGLVLVRVCGAILGLFGTKNDTYQDEDDFILE